MIHYSSYTSFHTHLFSLVNVYSVFPRVKMSQSSSIRTFLYHLWNTWYITQFCITWYITQFCITWYITQFYITWYITQFYITWYITQFDITWYITQFWLSWDKIDKICYFSMLVIWWTILRHSPTLSTLPQIKPLGPIPFYSSYTWLQVYKHTKDLYRIEKISSFKYPITGHSNFLL